MIIGGLLTSTKTTVFDVHDKDLVCAEGPEIGNYYEFALAFLNNVMPIICGGYNGTAGGSIQNCYKLQDLTWVHFATLPMKLEFLSMNYLQNNKEE